MNAFASAIFAGSKTHWNVHSQIFTADVGRQLPFQKTYRASSLDDHRQRAAVAALLLINCSIVAWPRHAALRSPPARVPLSLPRSTASVDARARLRFESNRALPSTQARPAVGVPYTTTQNRRCVSSPATRRRLYDRRKRCRLRNERYRPTPSDDDAIVVKERSRCNQDLRAEENTCRSTRCAHPSTELRVTLSSVERSGQGDCCH
jgi:hypothetical protein